MDFLGFDGQSGPSRDFKRKEKKQGIEWQNWEKRRRSAKER